VKRRCAVPRRCRRALSAAFVARGVQRLGFADPPESVPFGLVNSSVVDTPAHRALAKEAADQSLVLLKNTEHTLPLTAMAGKTVAVIGRNAAATSNMQVRATPSLNTRSAHAGARRMASVAHSVACITSHGFDVCRVVQGNYYGQAPFLISPVAGLGAYAKTVTCDGSDVDAAVTMAEGADAVVLVVGLTSEGAEPADEAEAHDRTSLIMPNDQDALVTRVAAAAAAKSLPVALVVMSGGPVDLTAAKSDPNVSHHEAPTVVRSAQPRALLSVHRVVVCARGRSAPSCGAATLVRAAEQPLPTRSWARRLRLPS
jgi:hypothetical protein